MEMPFGVSSKIKLMEILKISFGTNENEYKIYQDICPLSYIIEYLFYDHIF